MSATPSILLSFFFFYNNQIENTPIANYCTHKQMCTSALQFSLIYNKNAPDSTAGTLYYGSKCLVSWKNLTAFPPLTQPTDCSMLTQPSTQKHHDERATLVCLLFTAVIPFCYTGIWGLLSLCFAVVFRFVFVFYSPS